ncbi:pentatricopeptide repeat-containing protein At5g66520 isoform X1 [Dendrobium catenatum]|uniref:Pentatricopeptide repeat-containing protein n=2 Tax=Dendrobium catenatum TaxID=906689 RepID=A0A2I0V7G7_9ASPA|nr:pentatricopeptide repeat-containing protein At5g66520 isoform X1 [Dendrobium catenatum]PKU59346.1 Pentatricopeptide repeat-containing protein [Dendrobium catenatum]
MKFLSLLSRDKIIVQRAMALIDNAAAVDDLLKVHAFLVKTSFDHNMFVLAKFLRRCLERASDEAIMYGRAFFDQIELPDAFIWNTIIRAYLLARNPGESLRLFRQMCRISGSIATADSHTFSICIQACGRSEKLITGSSIHAQSVKLGFCSDLFVQTALVDMYANSEDICNARRVFDEMPDRDLVVYNAMLADYVYCGDISVARFLFDEMPERDLISWNTMIHGYAKSGDIGAAREMFDEMKERDLVSWSSIISAYAQCGKSNEALMLFHEMQLHGVVPDKVTMVIVLSACGDMGALGMGKAIHRLIKWHGIAVDIKLGTSLIDMYANCGDIENSLGVFYSMTRKDALTWSAMIIGLASHGLGKDALDLFSKMILEGVQPNDVTFVGVLSACDHSGLLSEGKAHFDSMTKLYGIKPKMEHYGCMVDLLGRLGLIKEARKLLIRMPFEPDAVVWRALLGACLIHKNVDMAEEAIINLINLEPHVYGHYVLLSNVYAQANKWDDMAIVRRTMRGKSILKVPGCSFIELENVVHEFVAGDRSHPKTNEIYRMAEDIIDQVRKAGY